MRRVASGVNLTFFSIHVDSLYHSNPSNSISYDMKKTMIKKSFRAVPNSSTEKGGEGGGGGLVLGVCMVFFKTGPKFS